MLGLVLERAYLGGRRILRGEDPTLRVHELIARLSEARRAGFRVVLLSVDSLGGSTKAGLALYDALRSFSDAGGFVVAWVQVAASCAAWVALAADVVVAAPDAVFQVHSASADVGGVPATGRWELAEVSRSNQTTVALTCSRSLVPVEDATAWVETPRGRVILASDAVALGMADLEGPREDALALARSIAGGASWAPLPSSARGEALARPPRFEAEERQARREGRYVAECLSLCHARAVKRLRNIRTSMVRLSA